MAAGFKNMIFSTPSGEMKKFFYYNELNSGDSYQTEITFRDKVLVEASKYKLEEPTSEELKIYYDNMDI